MIEPPDAVLRRLLSGWQVAQAIHVAAELGIADELAAGPRSSDELAAATGAHADALRRLLRALAAVGVLHEDDDGRLSLTAVGACLRADAPDSLRAWAMFVGRGYYRAAWAELEHSVRTGENAFRHVHGVGPWEYRAGRPEESALFDAALEALARGSVPAVLAAYDFGRFGTVVDVGGGNGAFAAAMLVANPELRGVVFDQPHVVAGAGEVLARAGVADRCEAAAGSFFDAVPPGGDAYVLKQVIHDWEDGDAIAILRVCRRAVPPEGAVLLVERELGPPNAAPASKLSDLNMLVAPGGRERTTDEYAALLAAARLRLARVVPSASGWSVFEAVPA